MKKDLMAIFLVFLVVLSTNFIFSQDNNSDSLSSVNGNLSLVQGNLTSQQKAIQCLSESRRTLEDLSGAGFNIERVNDTFFEANLLYNSFLSNNNEDFSRIIESCKEIGKIKELAYLSVDEFNALKKFYNKSITSDVAGSEDPEVISGINAFNETLAEIEMEINDERYEVVNELINNAYDEITDLQATYSGFQTIKRQTANIFKKIFFYQWKFKLTVLLIVLFLFLLFRRSILKNLINRKLGKLGIRRTTLKSLIRKNQRAYFESGNISESTYKIRIKKFGEMIRDIDRQIPLLNEGLVKLTRNRDVSLIKKVEEINKKNKK